ncbi:MAG: 30S ribosome-binding factor RbfA [Planctomycetes bacterium]|nr:30S ribosome-binding factor RbfA [Planctomycetota bacterium]
MSRRQEKIARELQRALAQIIPYELTDPRIQHVTITRVEATADLRTAKVFFSVLGGEKESRRVIWGLIHAKRFIQAAVGRRVKLRILPQLTFVYDDSIAGSIRIIRLVESLVKKPDAAEAEGGEPHADTANVEPKAKVDATVDETEVAEEE